MIKLTFNVNNDGVLYFKSKLNKVTNFDLCIIHANDLCKRINELWNRVSCDINNSIFNFFGELDYEIKVEVYPEYFFLGAINIDKGILVLGQPSRSENFYGGILLHEIIHFVLKEKKIKRFIEEIICFLFERKFILDNDGISIDDFEYEKGTDDFHVYAIEYSKKFYNSFLGFYERGDFIGLLEFLNKSVDDDKKNIKISNNLNDYLKQNG